MDKRDAQHLTRQLMDLHGLTDWAFSFNNRRRANGVCNYTRKTIFLSHYFVVSSPEDAVRQTVLHEIAHALTPGHGHDHVWLRKAREIGYLGQRTCEMTEEHMAVISKTARYRAVCKNGHERFAFKMPKRKKSCGTCAPYFSEEFILDFKLVA